MHIKEKPNVSIIAADRASFVPDEHNTALILVASDAGAEQCNHRKGVADVDVAKRMDVARVVPVSGSRRLPNASRPTWAAAEGLIAWGNWPSWATSVGIVRRDRYQGMRPPMGRAFEVVRLGPWPWRPPLPLDSEAVPCLRMPCARLP